jgi:hypothetical protein
MPCASVPCPAAVPEPGASKVIVFWAAARPAARSSTLISLQDCCSLITLSSVDLEFVAVQLSFNPLQFEISSSRRKNFRVSEKARGPKTDISLTPQEHESCHQQDRIYEFCE